MKPPSITSHRGILTVLVSAALLAVTVIATAAWHYAKLPDPAEAGRRDLLRWLVTRDLEHVPEATRAVLARRLAEEFAGETDWEGMAHQLTDRQRQRMEDNVVWLVGPWLRECARRYDALPEADRTDYLDQFIDALRWWRDFADRFMGSSLTDAAASDLPAAALEPLEGRPEYADLAAQQRTRAFLHAVRARWVMRELSEQIEAATRRLFRDRER